MDDKIVNPNKVITGSGEETSYDFCEKIELYKEDFEIDLFQTSNYHMAHSLPDYLKKSNNNFSILSLNIQSIQAKIDSLKVYVASMSQQGIKFNAICIQESWLADNHGLIGLQIDGYNCFSQGKHCSAHAGLIIYVDNEFDAVELKSQSVKSNVSESMFLEITGGKLKNKILLGNIYKPPKIIIIMQTFPHFQKI